MSFTNSFFLIGLLPVSLLMLTLAGKNRRLWMLLLGAFNVLFYLFAGAGALAFLCGYVLITWVLTRLILLYPKKLLFAAGCLLLTLPLLAVKYTAFAISIVNSAVGIGMTLPGIAVPMGISFFTFTALACFSDYYQRRETVPITLPEAFLYLTFFPTVTSGPIMRIRDFRGSAPGKADISDIFNGMERIGWGLCKKLLIADKLAPLADYYFNGMAAGRSYSVPGLWIGSAAYALQLYFDFSGYSDIAIGIASIIGIRVPENFDHPYHASSVQDFWRRWHISLSTWFRDYIYIPLGGSRCSRWKHMRNLLCVWLLTGLWHGAGWNFVAWGLGYFILLTAEKNLPFMKKLNGKWYGRLYTLLMVDLLWIPFRADNFAAAMRYLGGMFSIGHIGAAMESIAMEYLPFLCAVILGYGLSAPVGRLLKDRPVFIVIRRILLATAMILCIAAILNASYTPYIYGQF